METGEQKFQEDVPKKIKELKDDLICSNTLKRGFYNSNEDSVDELIRI